MAFRNPLTSLPSSGIIGLIQGSQLAADSINGKTIIGATIETAADGTPRIIIGPAAYNAGEPSIAWDLAGTGIDWNQPHIVVDPATRELTILGQQGALALAQLLIKSGAGAGVGIELKAYGATGSTVADLLVDGDSGQVLINSHPVPFVVGGSTVATPNASGQIDITYPVTFAASPQITACNGDDTAAANVGVAVDQSLHSTTQGRVRLRNAATGALITSGSRRVNWIACGLL